MRFISLQKNRGYTLLFAVLIATLVLGVAVFILSVSRKQYILSATARESLYAMYASDSGIECGALESNKSQWETISIGSTATFNCANIAQQLVFQPTGYINSDGVTYPSYIDAQGDQPSGQVLEAYFSLAFKEYPSGGIVNCSLLSIFHFTTNDGKVRTVVQSRGYNVCVYDKGIYKKMWGPDTSSPRTVERARQLILGDL